MRTRGGEYDGRNILELCEQSKQYELGTWEKISLFSGEPQKYSRLSSQTRCLWDKATRVPVVVSVVVVVPSGEAAAEVGLRVETRRGALPL